MGLSIKKYRLGSALLNAVFIGLISSGVRRYGTLGDPLNLSEVTVLFTAGFLLALGCWLINFRIFDFKPRYKNKHWLYTVFISLAVTLIMSLFYISVLSYFRGIIIENRDKFETLNALFSWGFFRTLLINFYILIIKYSIDTSQVKQEMLLKNEMLINENTVAKFEALKQQVNPHFLFNSLNSLKSLIKTDPDRSVDFVIRMADVYRYLLKHGKNPTVPLHEELDFMNAYIFLLERRYEQNLRININLSEEYLNTFIPPVSLQILIENAVKHNIVSQAKPLMVKISAENGYILVENNLQPKYSIEKSEKIGLGTINNRYILLVNKGIEVKNEDGKFKIYLPLIYSL